MGLFAGKTQRAAGGGAVPLNIVVVMPSAQMLGGAERALMDLFREGQTPNARLHVIFLEEGPLVAESRGLGVETRVIRAGHLRELARMGATVARIAAQIRRWRGHVALGWMTKAHLYSGPAAKLAGVPALWFQMGLPEPQSRLDQVATRLPAQGILCCSDYVAQAQAQMRPARATRAVPLCVELPRFDPDALRPPAEMRQTLGLPPDGPLIGIVGRLQRWKGIHTLIAALPLLLQSRPDARVVVVGGKHDLEPDYPALLEAQIAADGLQQRVLMAGAQTHIPEWMQAMDVVIHASDREPFGIVVLEAMALGKPLVAGAEGGPREIITDGVNGLLASYGDAPALAQAITRYLDDPAWAREVGKQARVRAHDFSTARYARNVIEAVQSLI